MPDRLSRQRNPTVTSSAYHPLALAARSGRPPIRGATASMLTLALWVKVLPALSTAVPGTAWSRPSVLTLASGEQLATPDSASLQSYATVTGLLFQPLVFGAGVTMWPTVGLVRSILTVAVSVASSLPALSTLQYFRLWTPSVSIVSKVPSCWSPPSIL